MKKWHIHSVGAVMAFCLAAAIPANAQFQFLDNFSYVDGSNLHGQAGWQGWDNVASAGAVVSSAFSYSAPTSVNITGGSDLVHRFIGATSGLWTFSVRQYIPSTSTGTSYFILLNQYNDGGPYDWSVQIQYNMGTGMVVSDFGAGATLPLVRNAWADIRFDINLTANTVSEFYNGALLSTHAWNDATGLMAISAVDLYANNAGPVYYDDLSLIYVVPEPSAAALLALFGALGAVWTRRNRS